MFIEDIVLIRKLVLTTKMLVKFGIHFLTLGYL
jgi:hypothetical protein